MFKELFFDSYFIKILIATVFLGFATGSIGTFSTLRKQALIGDALSHAALPGVVIGFLLFGTRNLEVLLLGASFAALAAIILIELIKKYSVIKFDASMALILSSFFGLGNVLLSLITGADKSGLSKFIFGEAATILEKDVILIFIITGISLILVLLFWRHLKLFIFNEEFYHSLGFNTLLMRALLTFLTIIVVIVSIRAIGVILMSALLIAPSVTARLWSNKLKSNYIIAGILGALAAMIGTTLSFAIKGIPTGPIIVLVLSLFLIISLLISPKKGALATTISNHRHKKLIHSYHDLVHLYEFGLINNIDNINHFLSAGLITKSQDNYILTTKGENLVINIMRGENLWG